MGMKEYAAELEKFSKVNDVYHFVGSTVLKKIKKSVVILVQIDEKQDKAYVVDLMGLNMPWFNRLTTILNLNPIGKFFEITEEGRKYYYSNSAKRKFKNDLYSFADGQIPAWACRSIEILFGIKDIYTLGINYNSYPIGSVMVFPRGDGKIEDFPEIEEFVALASKYLYKILIDNKKRLRIPEIKDDVTQSLIRNISHEIRTPLNAILGMMQIGTQMDMTDEIKASFAKNIWNSAYQLTHTVENLITLSELETNSVMFRFKNENETVISSVIEAVTEDVLKLYPNRHIHINRVNVG
ncbi:MAG: histidine kinase dimerization/phospho-acceptor domain-containing protein [Bacteroidota bacterium]|nr:histidine kinase dimerization/phospho-acceptor domain-containing protein [Bacteroidota bacterium]